MQDRKTRNQSDDFPNGHKMSLLNPNVPGVLAHISHLDLTHIRLSTFLRGSVMLRLWPLKIMLQTALYM